MRSKSRHEHQCSMLESINGAPRVEYSTTWGINRNSTLEYAHVAEELLPPDIMHDILEGYLPFLCKQLIIALQPYGLTIDYINSCIEGFQFGQDEKPSALPHNILKSGAGLGQNGTYNY